MTGYQDYQQERREALARADKARRAFYKKFAEFETSIKEAQDELVRITVPSISDEFNVCYEIRDDLRAEDTMNEAQQRYINTLLANIDFHIAGQNPMFPKHF